jgi:hypothetical protein
MVERLRKEHRRIRAYGRTLTDFGMEDTSLWSGSYKRSVGGLLTWKFGLRTCDFGLWAWGRECPPMVGRLQKAHRRIADLGMMTSDLRLWTLDMGQRMPTHGRTLAGRGQEDTHLWSDACRRSIGECPPVVRCLRISEWKPADLGIRTSDLGCMTAGIVLRPRGLLGCSRRGKNRRRGVSPAAPAVFRQCRRPLRRGRGKPGRGRFRGVRRCRAR